MSITYNNMPELVTRVLKKTTSQTFEHITTVYRNGIQNIWNNPNGVNATKISEQLGTDAKKVFEFYYSLGQFINSISPEDIVEINKLIGSYNLNEDGSVTILQSNE